MADYDEAIRHQVLMRLLSDQENAQLGSLARYMEEFPGHESLVEDEFRSITNTASPNEIEYPQFKRYKIIEELGRGGQAIVYKAQDKQLGRQLALKVLTQSGLQQENAMPRFRREAEVTSRLNDPGICSIFESGVENGHAFIAMAYVEGPPLNQYFEENKRDPYAIAKILERVAISLHRAHQSGVIHRDVKPGNILIGQGDLPVLLDFGLAGDLHDSSPGLTSVGEIFGTPTYMAPEQINPTLGKIDSRTDVYSLGVTLFECLLGSRPFFGPTRESLYRAIQDDEAPIVSLLKKEIPRDLSVIVETALQKDQDQRYSSAIAMAKDLQRFQQHQPISAKPTTSFGRIQKWMRRNPFVASVTAGLIVILSVALVLTNDAFEKGNLGAKKLLQYELQSTYRQRLNEGFHLGLTGAPDEAEKRFSTILAELDVGPSQSLNQAAPDLRAFDRERAEAELGLWFVSHKNTPPPAMLTAELRLLAQGLEQFKKQRFNIAHSHLRDLMVVATHHRYCCHKVLLEIAKFSRNKEEQLRLGNAIKQLWPKW